MVQYQQGPVCGIENCNSKRYYEDSGFRFCKNGHQQGSYVSTQTGDENFGTQGRTTTKQKEAQAAGPQKYTGVKANELFLKSYQHILRKQSWTLIHTHRFPSDYESIVKALWELRLQLLKDKLTPGGNTEEVFSSQAQSDTEDEDGIYKAGKRWDRRGAQMPTLPETLALCYLAAAVLRLPIGLGDFQRWAVREDIPFIRAIREVPQEMQDRLPAQHIAALDTQSLLNPDDLRKSVIHLCLLYSHSFELVLPPLNHPLFLFRYIRDLALPLEVFTASRDMAKLLSIPFSFPTLGTKQATSSFPEVQLMALVTIAVKLYHPFDNKDRYAYSLTDPGVMTIDWDVWCKEQKEFDGRETSGGRIGRGNEMKIGEQQVLDMTGDQMDEYLDWYERTWTKERNQEDKNRGLPTQLLDMFPTGRPDGSTAPAVDLDQLASGDREAVDAKLKAVQGSLRLRGVVSKEKERESKEPVPRIGSSYKRYRKRKELPRSGKVFYDAAAHLIAVSTPTLILAVLQTEQKLQDYRNKQIKEGKASDSKDEAALDDPGDTIESEVQEKEAGEGVGGPSFAELQGLESLAIDTSVSALSEVEIDH